MYLCEYIGSMREIRMKFMEVNNQWEAWVAFSCHEEALQAKINIDTLTVCDKVVGGDLTDRLPQHLDVYRPVEWVKQPSPHQETSCDGERPPAPPVWLVARAKDEKFNHFKFSRYLQKEVGGIFSGDISRFNLLTAFNCIYRSPISACHRLQRHIPFSNLKANSILPSSIYTVYSYTEVCEHRMATAQR